MYLRTSSFSPLTPSTSFMNSVEGILTAFREDLVVSLVPDVVRRWGRRILEIHRDHSSATDAYDDNTKIIPEALVSEASRLIRETLNQLEKEEFKDIVFATKKVAYCSSYGGGFKVSPSFSKYLKKVGGTEDDRDRIGGSMITFGKEKAAEFPQTFSVVLAYLRRNPPGSVRRFMCKPMVCRGNAKSLRCFEEAIHRVDGKEVVDWDAFNNTRFPAEMMKTLEGITPASSEEDGNEDEDLWNMAYEEFGLQCASDRHCRMCIKKIRSIEHYNIQEYDGMESVV